VRQETEQRKLPVLNECEDTASEQELGGRLSSGVKTEFLVGCFATLVTAAWPHHLRGRLGDGWADRSTLARPA
jgi:hypothetical protein